MVAGSPSLLRGSGVILQGHARSLRQAAARVDDAAAVSGAAWLGSAALRFRARSALVSTALDLGAGQAETVARATARFADDLERAQQDVALLDRRRTACREELDVLLRRSAEGLAEDAGQVLARRIEALHGEIAALDRRVHAVLEELTGWQRRYRQVLDDVVPRQPDWVSALEEIGRGASQAAGGARTLLLAVLYGWHASRAGAALAGAERLYRAGKAAEILRLLREPPWWARALGVLPLRQLASLDMMLRTGTDVLTGGGYVGWRGGVTRYFAAEATVGAMAISSRNPIAVVVGAGLVAKWSLWKGGNTVWDNRAVIQRFAAKVWRGVRAGATSPVGRRVLPLLSPAERGRVAARWLSRQVHRTRDYGPGRPIRLPDNLRLPKLPGLPRLPPWRVPPAVPPALPPVRQSLPARTPSPSPDPPPDALSDGRLDMPWVAPPEVAPPPDRLPFTQHPGPPVDLPVVEPPQPPPAGRPRLP